MIGRGELGFVLAADAMAAGILPGRAYVATVWALVLATLLGPIAFRASLQCHGCLTRGAKPVDAATVEIRT